VLEKGWREGQYKLAALSTDSIFLTAEKSNHMIHNDQPEVVLEAIRSILAQARQNAHMTTA
jgi:pimeloyl-ACP methyl ester carboxylesterase